MPKNHEETLYEWISARETRLSCARTLAGFSCEWFERGSSAPDDPGVPRCYQSGNDEADWCGSCRQRNKMYQGVTKLRDLERRAFRRLCRSAHRFKANHDGGRSPDDRDPHEHGAD